MKKVIRDGKVAVLYSPGYGAGWSTWSEPSQSSVLAMDARIVNAFLSDGPSAAATKAREMFPDFYTGGAEDLTVHWLPVGTQFEIQEYDGSESIRTLEGTPYLIA